MKSIYNFLSTHKHFYILLLFIPLQIWFQSLERFLIPKYITNIPLDNSIPFIKEFVIPYVLWFLFVPYAVIYTGLRSKREFYKLFIFLFGGMLISCTIFTLFPNAQGLRPKICASDPFSSLIKFIYATDTPTDVCPSMHVINSIAVNAALRHTNPFAEKESRKTIASVLTVLICLSTLFIKQHSIIDVICGIVIAVIFYIPLYALPNRKPQVFPYGSKSKLFQSIFSSSKIRTESVSVHRFRLF